MDLTAIRKLVRLMQQAELTELEIDDTSQGFRVHLKRGPEESAGPTPSVVMMPGAPAAMPASVPPPGPAAEAASPAPVVDGEVIKSPMVGTFYRSPSPDADPFVEAGSKVGEETVICIIEAMKVMNEIKAEMSGTVVEVLAENGEPVEFGQPLFVIKKA